MTPFSIFSHVSSRSGGSRTAASASSSAWRCCGVGHWRQSCRHMEARCCQRTGILRPPASGGGIIVCGKNTVRTRACGRVSRREQECWLCQSWEDVGGMCQRWCWCVDCCWMMGRLHDQAAVSRVPGTPHAVVDFRRNQIQLLPCTLLLFGPLPLLGLWSLFHRSTKRQPSNSSNPASHASQPCHLRTLDLRLLSCLSPRMSWCVFPSKVDVIEDATSSRARPPYLNPLPPFQDSKPSFHLSLSMPLSPPPLTLSHV